MSLGTNVYTVQVQMVVEISINCLNNETFLGLALHQQMEIAERERERNVAQTLCANTGHR